MFEQSTLPSRPASKRLWGACLGVTSQALLVGFGVLAPMLWPQVLPPTGLLTTLLPPVPPGRPKADPDRPRPTPSRTRTAAAYRSLAYVEPTNYSFKPPVIVDPPPDVDAGGPGIPGGVGDPAGVDDGIVGGILRAGEPPAPRPHVAESRPTAVAPTPVTEIKRVKVGGLVKMAALIHRVEPQYPAMARSVRVQGVVELVGVIATDGHLKELTVVSGHPLLAHAAIEAVSQWIYRPTTLNGEPVEVIAPITVTFRLN